MARLTFPILLAVSLLTRIVAAARRPLSWPIQPCPNQQSLSALSLDKCLAQYYRTHSAAKLQWTSCPSSPIFQSQLGLTNQLSNNATPAAFVLPASAADVAAAVRCVLSSGFPFSIRGGGHSYVAANLINGGVIIGMQVRPIKCG